MQQPWAFGRGTARTSISPDEKRKILEEQEHASKAELEGLEDEMQSEQAAELEQQRETLLAQLRMIDQQRIEMSAVNLSPAVSTQVKLKVEQAPATEPRIKQERTTPSATSAVDARDSELADQLKGLC